MKLSNYIETLDEWKEAAGEYEKWASTFENNTILTDEVAERTCKDNPLNIVGQRLGHKRKYSLYPEMKAEPDEEVYKLIVGKVDRLKEGYARKKAAADRSGKKYCECMVELGDSLWGIAKTIYGSGTEYQTIKNFEPNEITNATKIYPAQILFAPE